MMAELPSNVFLAEEFLEYFVSGRKLGLPPMQWPVNQPPGGEYVRGGWLTSHDHGRMHSWKVKVK